ncbi:RES family NAD+ phosphorylase [Flavobacterium sp.]|uniref:RES family NAD+ phosphorylase n=1 Tax=Flavobacterium sp. TaxID=239 RepID=UPI0012287CCD|nr:RES family NAD+ phosphorylase [Flavobacterium sp.]RZJ71727.1 MAG: RES domain-containing protein [Flavobacterium sp.]
MEAYRLSTAKYASVLSGYGAALKGARWNSQGIEMIYMATNRSLAMAEVAVHMSIGTLPPDYMMITIHIPDDTSTYRLPQNSLPPDRDTFPHSITTQAIGDAFIFEKKFCVMQVPSAVTKGDYNLLINPGHPEFKMIRIISSVKFPFDTRLIR